MTLAVVGRGVDFVWRAGNLSAEVARDPGQGIYVPKASDPTGATGAYVRNYSGPVDLAWWGAIDDGVVTDPYGPAHAVVSGTDNAVAMANFGVWARGQSVASKDVHVFNKGSPGGTGTYLFSGTNCFGCFWNIRKLVFGGGKWQNTYVTGNGRGGWPWPTNTQVFRDNANVNKRWLINSTLIGAQSFTTTTAADAANFSAGEWVMLGSLDIQNNGFPQNMQYHDFVRVTGINATTGVVTIDRKLRNAHRSDYADYTANPTADACGKARVWKLDTAGWTASNGTQYGGGEFVDVVTWDVDHTYHDLAVYPGLVEGSTYAQNSCRKWTDINWEGVGFGETVAKEVYHYRPDIRSMGFPDKNVDLVVYEDFTWKSDELLFPASSIDRVVLRNGTINDGLGIGGKNVVVDSCDINQLGWGMTIGLSQSIKVVNSRIASVGSAAPQHGLFDGAELNLIDGTNASFANGVIKLLKTGFPTGWPTWCVVPGCYVALEARISGASVFPGDVGVGHVLSVTEDATHVLITTDLPYASLPAWCSRGGIWIFRNMEVTFENCTGCDEVRLFSEACGRGKRYFEYKRYTIGGITAASANDFFSDISGALVSVECNVINPSPNSGSVLTLGFTSYDVENDFAIDAYPSLRVTIDADVAGKRVVTQTSKAGFSGIDAVTISDVAQTYLPSDRVLGRAWSWSLNNNGVISNAYQAAKIEIALEFDCGSVRRPVTVQYANGGAAMVNVQGALP